MTSIHIYDPGDGPQLPELPPLPVAILMVGTHDLLAQANDLPQPTGIIIQADQRANLEFPPDRASVRAVTRWALRFGAIVISTPCEFPDGPRTLCRADFDYYGIAVTVYAFISAAPARLGRGTRPARRLPAPARQAARLPRVPGPVPLHIRRRPVRLRRPAQQPGRALTPDRRVLGLPSPDRPGT